MADRNTTPYYQLFEQLKHQFCQWIFVERHTLVAVTEKFNRLFEDMSGGTGFRMRAGYENWVTRKRKWDKEWQIGQPKRPSGDTGPATEILEELNDLPLWWVGNRKIRDLTTGQILFNPPSLLERYESRIPGNDKLDEHEKGASRTKKPKHTLHSSKLEPVPLAHDAPACNTMTSSTCPNGTHFGSKETNRGFYPVGEKHYGLDDHPGAPVGNIRGYGNCYWPVDPSSAGPNLLHSYNEPILPVEELYGLSAAQAPYSQSSPQEMMLEKESSNDDRSILFMQGMS